MKHISKAINLEAQQHKAPASTKRLNALPTNLTAMIFSKMQVTYTHLWTSAFPTTEQQMLALETWGEQLAGLTEEQVMHGLNNLKDLKKDYPPNPMQFKDLCIGHSEHNTRAYKPFDRSKALDLKPSKEVAKKHLDEIKQKLGMPA